PRSDHYFGRTKLKEMAGWVERTRKKAQKDPKELAKLDADFEAVADWLGRHPRPEQDKTPPPKAFENRCAECHSYNPKVGEEPSKGPDFTGYGDTGWLRLMIWAPDHPRRYGEKNQMPAFRELEAPGGEIARADFLDKHSDGKAKLIQLSDVDRELIIRYILDDNRVVFGGTPIAAPPIKND